MRRYVLMCGLCLALVGCRLTRGPDGGTQVEWRIVETLWNAVFDRDDAPDTEIDRLYRQGYGFNNPNVERIRNDLPPVNLDGSVHRSASRR